MAKTLDELALKYGTDKSSEGHNYCPHYEKHLPEKVNKFLEIGAWKGAGIRMFKEWYNNEGQFYAFDRFLDGHGLITIGQLQAEGINSFEGSQSDLWFLETIKDKFTVISEDASHHWGDQILTFKRMFVNNMEEGGVYVCEDIFDEPYWGQGVIANFKDNLWHVLNRVSHGGNFESQMFSREESDMLMPLIGEINLYTDIAFIKRK